MNKEREKAQRQAQRQEEASQDLVAARKELLERRDQMLAELDEKLAALDRLSRSLEAGEVEARAAQAQLRKLVGEGGRAGMRLAGRTRIGLSAPDAPALGQGGHGSQRAGTGKQPSRGVTGGGLHKVLAAMDARLVGILTARERPQSQELTRVEVALLLQLRRALGVHADGLPDDPVLLASVRDYLRHTEQVLGDLDGSPAQRLERMIDFNRTLLAQLVASGGKGGDLRAELKAARAKLQEPSAASEEAVGKVVVTVFEKLRKQLAQKMPSTDDALLERLLAGASQGAG